MRSCLITFAALLFLASTPSIAFAGTVRGSGGGFSGSGTFITTSNGDGTYTIISLTGDANSGIQGLIAVDGFNGNDNQLYPNDPSVVDGSGFSFTDAQGDTSFQVDIFSSSPGEYSAYLVDSDVFSETIPVTLTIAGAATPQTTHLFSSLVAQPTQQSFSFAISQDTAPSLAPEPSSLVLLGTGLVAVGGTVRRRFAA